MVFTSSDLCVYGKSEIRRLTSTSSQWYNDWTSHRQYVIIYSIIFQQCNFSFAYCHLKQTLKIWINSWINSFFITKISKWKTCVYNCVNVFVILVVSCAPPKGELLQCTPCSGSIRRLQNVWKWTRAVSKTTTRSDPNKYNNSVLVLHFDIILPSACPWRSNKFRFTPDFWDNVLTMKTIPKLCVLGLAVVSMLWASTLRWKQSPSNSQRSCDEVKAQTTSLSTPASKPALRVTSTIH